MAPYEQFGDLEHLRALDGLAHQLRHVAASGTQPPGQQFLGWKKIGNDYFGVGRFERALECYREALKIRQDLDVTLKVIRLLELLGQSREGHDLLDFVESGDPRILFLRALYAHREGNDADALDYITKVLSDKSVKNGLRARTLFLSGHILDRVGQYEDAFDAFARANQLRAAAAAQERPDLGQQARSYLEDLYKQRAWYTSRRLEELARHTQQLRQGIDGFLVGFPRSGTTLLAQALASHPAISVLEERDALPFVFQDLLGSNDHRAAMLRLEEAEAVIRQAAYRDRRAALLGPGSQTVCVDKNPLHIVNLDLIRRFFPDAKVLVVTRDPRDCVLSNFQQDYRLNLATYHSRSLEAAANFYAAVMGTYRGVWTRLGLDLLEIRYEDFVDDLESVLREVCGFLGVPWDDSTLRYHLGARREINNPSYYQVRKDLHQRGRDRWRNYSAFIDPVVSILKPSIMAL